MTNPPDVHRILLTGATGYLGSYLAPLLLADGFHVVGIDMADAPASLPPGVPFVKATLADAAAVRQLMARHGPFDLIVHTASVHQWKPYTDDEYLDANVKGTWHLYAAAADAGVGRVVFSSSIAAAGYFIPPARWPVTEETPIGVLGDVYAYTKHAQELAARSFADRGLVRTIALRPPAFSPIPGHEHGLRLTGTWMDLPDVADAHVAAARVMAGRQAPGRPLAPFEAVFTTNRLPYTSADADLIDRPGQTSPDLVRRHWPDAAPHLPQAGQLRTWLAAAYDLSKAQQLLGWQPTYNFDEWWVRHRPSAR